MAHEKMSRPASDAEPDVKNVRFAEHATEHVPPAVSTSHSSSTPVTHGWIIFIFSAVTTRSHCFFFSRDLMTVTSTLVQKKLKLSDPGNLPSDAPMGSDANLSSDDTQIECLLERLERKRVAKTLSDLLERTNSFWRSLVSMDQQEAEQSTTCCSWGRA